MKKIVLLLFLVVFMAGCEVKEENFTKICTNKIESKNIIDETNQKIIFNNKDEVLNIVITKTYEAKDDNGNEVIDNIKKSSKNYNNNLLKSKNIKIKNTKNEKNIYVLEYYYDVSKMKKNEIEQLDFNKNAIKYFNKLKKDGISCK